MRGVAHCAFWLILPLLAGCATVPQGQSFVGQPIAAAVRELGPPDSVADYRDKGRFFTWSLSDVRLVDESGANPANWLDPMTRSNAPQGPDERKLVSLPDFIVSPPFRPGPCTLSLIAQWDERARGWVATKAIRKGAAAGGHCGMRR